MTEVKVGTRLRSAVCDTEVMVIAAPAGDLELSCGGSPMVGLDEESSAGGAPSADAAGGTQMGKRYTNDAGDIELLCTKAGAGSIAAGGEILVPKDAKPLPSSD